MSERFKRLWHDPVWSKVFASGILSLMGGAVLLFGWATDRLSPWIEWSYNQLTRSSIPNWIVIALAIIFLVSLVKCLSTLGRLLSEKPAPATFAWSPYRTDVYQGIKWRWDYTPQGVIINLRSYCPHCDYRVLPRSISPYRIDPRMGFHCEDCKRRLGEFDGYVRDLESVVIRWVEKRIRNNLWLN